MQLYYHFRPPIIRILRGSPPYQVTVPKLQLPFSIESTQGIKDVFLWRGKRKIFYRPIQFANPRGKKQLSLKIPITLKPGLNRMRLYVRTAQGRFHRTFYLTYTTKY